MQHNIIPQLLEKAFADSSQWNLQNAFVQDQHHIISFINAHAINNAYKDPLFANALLQSHSLLLDGIGAASALTLFGYDHTENLNGTDLIPKILDSHIKKRIAIYGTSNETLAILRKKLNDQGFEKIVSTLNGFLDYEAYVVDAEANKPDIIILCMGMPKQELLSLKLTPLAPLVICAGGWADFYSGNKKRAPLWVQKIHAEWFHRLLNEPIRLGKRYTIDIAYFYIILLKSKFLSQKKGT